MTQIKTEKCGISTNVPQLLRLLGPSMYKNDTIKVAIKELLQNSFDAVKRTKNPIIKISSDSANNSITVVDNGCGMSMQTVKDVYLSIGGTLKDLDVTERSGGLGLAKVQFFLSANRMKVVTTKDGYTTTLECSQEELFSSEAQCSCVYTGEPNGTSVTLQYPQKVTAIDGSITYISVPRYMPPSANNPLLGYDINVTFNGDAVCETPKNYTETMRIEFVWGKIVVYYDPTYVESFSYVPVHSAGLFQFNKYMSNHSENLHFKCAINVLPKVPAGQAGYPFNNTREGFNVSVEEDIKTLGEYLFNFSAMLKSAEIERKLLDQKPLQYITVDGKEYEDKEIERKEIKYNKKFFDDMLESFRSLSSKYESIFEEEKEASTEFNFDNNDTNSCLKLLNENDSDTSSKTEFYSKFASVLLDAVRDSKIENAPQVCGVVLSDTRGGCLITSGSIRSLYVNPHRNAGNATEWVEGVCFVFSHELAHLKCSWHDEDFCQEQHRIWCYLADKGILRVMRGKLYKLYNNYCIQL